MKPGRQLQIWKGGCNNFAFACLFPTSRMCNGNPIRPFPSQTTLHRPGWGLGVTCPLCLPFNPSGLNLIYWGAMRYQIQMRTPGFLVQSESGSQFLKCRNNNTDGIFGRDRGEWGLSKSGDRRRADERWLKLAPFLGPGPYLHPPCLDT